MKQTAFRPVDLSYIEEFSTQDVTSRQYSTLDLCDHDKFTLIGNIDVPGVRNCRLGRDFEVLDSKGNDWLEKSGLSLGGSLLIRPDQHILMVVRPGDTNEDVRKTIMAHLGLQ